MKNRYLSERVDYAHPINEGLVGWWPLNEGAGPNARSMLGLFDGVLTNTPVWNNDVNGKSVTFAGSNQHILVSDSSTFDNAKITVSLWLNSTTLASWRTPVSHISPTTPFPGWYLEIDSTGHGSFTCPNGKFTTAALFAAKLWYHWVITHDGTNDLHYVNGLLIETKANTDAAEAAGVDLRIGILGDLTQDFVGSVSDVRVWNRILTASEVQKLYLNSHSYGTRKIVKSKDVAAPNFVETTASSSGVAVTTGVGIAVWDSVGSSAGVGTVTGVGVNVFDSVGSSSGVGAATGVGVNVFDSVGSSSGVGAATGVGIAIWDSVGESSGVGAATGVSGSIDGAVGDSQGVSVVDGIAGSVIIETTASSVGSSTVSGVAAAVWDAVGASSGVATASGVGSLTFDSVGSSSGVVTVDGISSKIAGVAGDSQGVTTVTGISISVFDSVGNSVGQSTVTGAGVNVFDSLGSSSGLAAVTGLANAIWDAVGSSVGAGDVVGLASVIWDAVGNAQGVGTALADAVDIGSGSVGSSDGSAAVDGISATVFAAVGNAQGSSSATGHTESGTGTTVTRPVRKATGDAFCVGGKGYLAIPSTQVNLALGSVNDHLARIVLTVDTIATATCSVKDGSAGSSIPVMNGATDTGIFIVDLGMNSEGAEGWLITTGAGLTAVAMGDFTG